MKRKYLLASITMLIGLVFIAALSACVFAYVTPDTRLYNVDITFEDGSVVSVTESQNINIAGRGDIVYLSVNCEYYPAGPTFPIIGICEASITGGNGEAYVAIVPNDNDSFIGYAYGGGGSTYYTYAGYANGSVTCDLAANNTYTLKITVAADNGLIEYAVYTMYNDPVYGEQDLAAGIVVEQSMGIVGALFFATGPLFGIYVSRVADVMQGGIVAIMFMSIGGLLVYYFVLGG